jgi:hypothetical protein
MRVARLDDEEEEDEGSEEDEEGSKMPRERSSLEESDLTISWIVVGSWEVKVLPSGPGQR